ncbi:MAG: hypothetical protein K0R31_2322 [Clostridiales bacterium]|nr:hypothetical protein [Clostridiales bacterium]
MELKQYFFIIYKRMWLIILIPVVTGIVSAFVSFVVLIPVYESNTTLYVINRTLGNDSTTITNSDLMVGEALVKDYRELIKSRIVTGMVVEELHLTDLTDSTLAGKVNVNLKGNTRVLEIKVEDSDPERARDIANKFAEVFIKKAVPLMKVDNIEVIDKAIASTEPVKPKKLTNVLLAVFIGMFASIGVIFLIEYLNDTIKTNEDVRQQLGLTVLGTIPVMDIE